MPCPPALGVVRLDLDSTGKEEVSGSQNASMGELLLSQLGKYRYTRYPAEWHELGAYPIAENTLVNCTMATVNNRAETRWIFA